MAIQRRQTQAPVQRQMPVPATNTPTPTPTPSRLRSAAGQIAPKAIGTILVVLIVSIGCIYFAIDMGMSTKEVGFMIVAFVAIGLTAWVTGATNLKLIFWLLIAVVIGLFGWNIAGKYGYHELTDANLNRLKHENINNSIGTFHRVAVQARCTFVQDPTTGTMNYIVLNPGDVVMVIRGATIKKSENYEPGYGSQVPTLLVKKTWDIKTGQYITEGVGESILKENGVAAGVNPAHVFSCAVTRLALNQTPLTASEVSAAIEQSLHKPPPPKPTKPYWETIKELDGLGVSAHSGKEWKVGERIRALETGVELFYDDYMRFVPVGDSFTYYEWYGGEWVERNGTEVVHNKSRSGPGTYEMMLIPMGKRLKVELLRKPKAN